MAQLHAEVTDFGFGPAHGLLAVVEAAPELSPMTVWSSGNALTLLRQSLPTAQFEEMLPHPASWERFFAVVPEGSAVLTMSIPFGEAARERGMWVAVLDQLHWMWKRPVQPAVDCYLTPDYFGVPSLPASGTRVAPLLGPHFTRSYAPPAGDEAVVAFGGMSVMGDPRAADDHARWLLAKLLPVVAEQPDIDVVHVVGGSPDLRRLVPDPAPPGARVDVHPVLSSVDYAQLLARSAVQFLSPGLATCYESEALGLAPFFLPATTKSGVMQAQHLRALGYPHVGRWSWHDDLAPAIGDLEQPEALPVVADAVRSSVDGEDTAWLDQARHYLAGPRTRLVLPTIDAPSAAHVLVQALQRR